LRVYTFPASQEESIQAVIWKWRGNDTNGFTDIM